MLVASYCDKRAKVVPLRKFSCLFFTSAKLDRVEKLKRVFFEKT
jgi:hypothetical protein